MVTQKRTTVDVHVFVGVCVASMACVFCIVVFGNMKECLLCDGMFIV